MGGPSTLLVVPPCAGHPGLCKKASQVSHEKEVSKQPSSTATPASNFLPFWNFCLDFPQ